MDSRLNSPKIQLKNDDWWRMSPGSRPRLKSVNSAKSNSQQGDVSTGAGSSMSDRIKMFGGGKPATSTKPTSPVSSNNLGKVSAVASKFNQPKTDINSNQKPTSPVTSKPPTVGWKPPPKPVVSPTNKSNIPDTTKKTVPPTNSQKKEETPEVVKATETKSPTPTSPKPGLAEGQVFNPLELLKQPAKTNVLKHVTKTKMVVTRIGDGKKFVKLPKSAALTNDLAPIKPLKLKTSDIKEIILEFQRAYDEFKNSNDELYDDLGNFLQPEEEEYDDVDNVLRKTSVRNSGRPVSLIPDMSEQEELESGGSASGSGSGSASGGSWSGGKPARADPVFEVEGEFDETYEELPEVNDKKEQEKHEKEEAERKKREEKERKEQEKKDKARLEREKKEEKKEKEKMEKQLREMRKKFKITGDEQKEAEGVVRSKAKGGRGGDLAVQADERVDIIRMTDNPKGRWLVRNQEGTYGYVESDNINVETPLIKQIMLEYMVQYRPLEYQYATKAMNLVDVNDEGPEEMYEELDVYQNQEYIDGSS